MKAKIAKSNFVKMKTFGLKDPVKRMKDKWQTEKKNLLQTTYPAKDYTQIAHFSQLHVNLQWS